MNREDYSRAVLEKLNPDKTITCEDCGHKERVGHCIVDHTAGTVRTVCHSCFVTKYQDGLYITEERNH